MPRSRLIQGGALAFGALLLFIVCTYIFFPISRINAAINQTLATQGLTLSPDAYKTILPGLGWDSPKISSEQGTLLRFDRLKIQPRLLSLLTGRITVDTMATLGNGSLALEYGVTGNRALALRADKIDFADIPFFKTVLGARSGGSLWSEGVVLRGAQGLNGELKLTIKQLEFSGLKLGAFPLPDVSQLASQGMVRITNGIARLESFSLQGDGIYMRLSGDIPSGANAANAPLGLVLEIMPKPEFLEKQKLVFLLLAKFMASPGVYRVPIKGTLLKPEIL
jgi:type II secretion system protein N